MSNHMLGIVGGVILIGLLIGEMCEKKKEYFESEVNAVPRAVSLFVGKNTNLKRDFKLVNYLQQLKFQTISTSDKYSIFNKQGWGTVDIPIGKEPILFVPGLGASSIHATWNNITVPLESCLTSQSTPTRIWPRNNFESDDEKICWTNVISNSSTDTAEGGFIDSWTPNIGEFNIDVENYTYMFENTLLANGYTKGVSLFCANYDFRKILEEPYFSQWCQKMTASVEKMVSINKKKAVLVGHSLGNVLINLFLQTREQTWKDYYIKSFVMMSPAIGGSVVAIREMIDQPQYQTFTGLQILLPNELVYGDFELYTRDSLVYSAAGISNIFRGNMETYKLYNTSTKPFQTLSLQPPRVPVYIFAGTGINTESSYTASETNPQQIMQEYPPYNNQQAYLNNFTYTQQFVGDGIVPSFVTEFPLQWSKLQSETIHYQFYEGVEHHNILNRYDPIVDFISILEK